MYKRIFLLFLLLPLFILANPEGEPELTNIEVKNIDGTTEVIFTLTDYASSSDFTMDNKIVIDLLQTKSKLDGNLWNINRGRVESIALSYISSASLTRIVVQRTGDFGYEISNPSMNTISLKFAGESEDFASWSTGGKATTAKEGKEESGYTYAEGTQERISMRLEGADLVTTLRSIAQASGMNIIIGDEVRGTITVELDNIEWEEALDLVLKTKGYTYIIENEVIRVGRPETFAKEQENIETSKPIKREIFVLEFSTPAEIQGAVKTLLSKRGSIDQDIRTNAIIVSDIELRLKEVESLIKALDKKTLQVAITSKIVDIDRTAARELGLEWQVLGLRNDRFNIDGDVSLKIPDVVSGAFVNVSTVQNWGSLLATLSALEQDQRLDITSNPRVTTVNNKEATIFGGKRFAITTLDINGQPITRWYQAGIELKVTPHINAVGDITMEISVEMSDVVPGSDNQVITETSSQTETLVKNGQTLVIGGFFTKTVTETKTGIPILKDIPLLGLLFGHTASEERKREVLIFITPHIVETELGSNI
ncbi:secretin and TonB N-terminal domain-containing protein [candidate division WOR-3 bacterium]|nr:secretin and TonB N-terminal domain-containing protein [candidate division WOR-3 bacterium]